MLDNNVVDNNTDDTIDLKFAIKKFLQIIVEFNITMICKGII